MQIPNPNPLDSCSFVRRLTAMKFRSILPFSLLSLSIDAAPPPAEMKLDLDHDGKPERIVNKPGRTEILFASGTPAPFQLPDGISFLDDKGGDAGLRLADLNGDGFDDLLFSNGERWEVRLWNKSVQLHLGWLPGWSRLVHSGGRGATLPQLPPLAGTTVEVKDGTLTVTGAAQPWRIGAKELIAFPMPPAKSPQDALT